MKFLFLLTLDKHFNSTKLSVNPKILPETILESYSDIEHTRGGIS
jgi:hypothetical protein